MILIVVDFGQSTKKAAFAVHFAAHYADLEHELLEIKSGFRLSASLFVMF